jgi:prepilin-type N-terminal cleavage/methylation domain-containing protein/prepilin-type processing-associated H-X9-DG protein
MCLHATNVKHFGRRRGPAAAFTLIELLVVVAIVSLLMSILLPSLSKARENARCLKCAVNIRSILQGSLSYLSTYGRIVNPQLFPQELGDAEFHHGGEETPLRGEGTVAGGEQSGVWDCPNAVKKRSPWTDPMRQGWDARYEFISYGANDWGTGEAVMDTTLEWPWLGMLEYLSDPNDPYWDLGKLWGIREGMVAQAAKFICFADSDRQGDWDQVIAPCTDDWCWGTESPGTAHKKGTLWGVNVGFFDGHVAWYPTFTYPEWDFTRSQRQVAGIMLADGRPRLYPEGLRGPWRMMWNRDFKPHFTKN